jgi:tetratricopeptide (TPR) repeat protein
MRRAFIAGLLVSLGAHSAAAQQGAGSASRDISALVTTGRLDSAQRQAARLGPALGVTLADILTLRGRLATADSVYRAAIAGRVPEYRSAEAALAELAARRGDWAEAVRRAGALITAYQADGDQWSTRDLIAAGRAYVVIGARDPQAFHDALQDFDRAAARDSSDVESRLRAADLLLDKYNAPDAIESYQQVLKLVPNEARALLGLARAFRFEGKATATDAARASLAANPALVPAHVLVAQLHLEAEAYDSANAAAARAIAIDSSAVQAWAILGAIAWLNGDSAGLARTRAQSERAEPTPVTFYAEIADAAARQRRYAAAVTMALQAVKADSLSARAYGVLAENQLRTGDMTGGRANLERAFMLDPYNLWHKNMLDLLDAVRGFKTIATRRFQLVAPAGEADYLALYVGPLLESAYDTFVVRYGYRPPTPIRVELYGRHADFSVRTVGLTGLGALGVSFGPVLVLDSPQAREVGQLNYGSTAWHELAHTFTLGLSGHRVPRWISEGLSVLEERRAGHGWGAQVSPDFLAVYKGGVLPSASQINEGLVRPRFPAEIGFSYVEASLVCEMIEAEHGIAAIRSMLAGFAQGLETGAVLQRVFAMTPEAFDTHFDSWLRTRYAGPLAVIDASDGTRGATGLYVTLVEQGTALLKAGRSDSARALLSRAQEMFPDDGTVDGPAWQLAHADRDAGNLRSAVAQINRVTMRSETAFDANEVEAALRLQIADSAGALDAMERQQWISPYDPALHVRLADLSEQLGDLPRAVRERRAIVALDPADRLEARFQLARVLVRAGDKAGARHELLQVLEQAPAFEKAQALLLQLQGGPT